MFFHYENSFISCFLTLLSRFLTPKRKSQSENTDYCSFKVYFHHRTDFSANMKGILLTYITTVTLTLAAPVILAGPAAVQPCTFSANEKANLGHNHDVNTGKIKIGGKVSGNAPEIFGSGCSPAWANGGAISDDSPQKTRNECKGGKSCKPA